MRSRLISAALTIVAIACYASSQADEHYQLGRAATDAEIRAWDIDVRADGTGAPIGHGSVSDGGRIYAEKCAACHGDRGQGGPMDKLVGGDASLTSSGPVKTVGSFWPHASTLFDYVRRAMPFNAPQSLTSDEIYSVVAYVLHLNGILPADASLDQSSLANVRMPNRNGFISDPRPDVNALPCETDCR